MPDPTNASNRDGLRQFTDAGGSTDQTDMVGTAVTPYRKRFLLRDAPASFRPVQRRALTTLKSLLRLTPDRAGLRRHSDVG